MGVMSTASGACVLICLALVGAAPADEVAPAASIPCFPGAIYRKAVSSVDVWTGIDCVVTLPTFARDPNRVDEKGKVLDNPSCYIGGRAGETEIDAGVSMEVIKEVDGTVSKERKAFRPFFRNKKWNTAPADPKLYFYGGDTIRMSCRTDAKDKLTLRIELVARGAAHADAPVGGVHEVTLDAFGFGPGNVQQFKRVSAIDQVANEGKPAKATKATAAGAIWSKVILLRGPDDQRPMIATRFTDMRCPDPSHVVVKPTDDPSGEQIDLVGAPAR